MSGEYRFSFVIMLRPTAWCSRTLSRQSWINILILLLFWGGGRSQYKPYLQTLCNALGRYNQSLGAKRLL